MSIKVTNWVWANSLSRNGARLVMLALADRADDNGHAWPSIEDICDRTKLSDRAVQKGITALVDLGELTVESGGGRRVRNRYQIIPKPRQIVGVTAEEPRTIVGVSEEETPNFATETPKNRPENPELCDGNPEESSGEPSVEPPREPSQNQQQTRASTNLPAVRQTAEAAERRPDWLAALQDAMSASGINVPWRFAGDDMIRLHNDIQRLGIPIMIRAAVDAVAGATKPPFSSRFFYDGWHRIPTPVGDNVLPMQPTSRQQRETDDMFDRAMQRAILRDQQKGAS